MFKSLVFKFFLISFCFSFKTFAAQNFIYLKPKRHGVLVYSEASLFSEILFLLKQDQSYLISEIQFKGPGELIPIILDDGTIGYVEREDMKPINKKKLTLKQLKKKTNYLYGKEYFSSNYLGLSYGLLKGKERFSSKKYKYKSNALAIYLYHSGARKDELPLDWTIFVIDPSDFKAVSDKVSFSGKKVMLDLALRNTIIETSNFQGYFNWGGVLALSYYKAFKTTSDKTIRSYNFQALRLGLSFGAIFFLQKKVWGCRPHASYKLMREKTSYEYTSFGLSCSY